MIHTFLLAFCYTASSSWLTNIDAGIHPPLDCRSVRRSGSSGRKTVPLVTEPPACFLVDCGLCCGQPLTSESLQAGSATLPNRATNEKGIQPGSPKRESVWLSGKAMILLWQLYLQKLWFMDIIFVILTLTVNETLKRLSSLPTVMQNHSGGDSVVLGIVPLFASPLRSRSPPVPSIRRQVDVKQV